MNRQTLIQRLKERAKEAGYPKSELYKEAANRIKELEKDLTEARALLGPSPGTMKISGDEMPGSNFP